MSLSKEVAARLEGAGHKVLGSLDELCKSLGRREQLSAGLVVDGKAGGYLLAISTHRNAESMSVLAGEGDFTRVVGQLSQEVPTLALEIHMIPPGGFPPCKDPRFCTPRALTALNAAKRQALVTALIESRFEFLELSKIPE